MRVASGGQNLTLDRSGCRNPRIRTSSRCNARVSSISPLNSIRGASNCSAGGTAAFDSAVSSDRSRVDSSRTSARECRPVRPRPSEPMRCIKCRAFIPVLAIALALAACTGAPYIRASSPTGVGFDEARVAPSTYQVTYTTGRFGSQQSADRQVRRRAREFCHGRFSELPLDAASVTIRSCDSHPWSPCRGRMAQIKVRCGD